MKIPPVFLLISLAALSWALSKTVPLIYLPWASSKILVGPIFLMAIILLGGSILSFKRAKTTVSPINPDKARHLVIQGPYRFSRNPMYLGMLLFLISWACFLGTFSGFFPIFVFFVVMSHIQIAREEKALIKSFGMDYENYMAQVRRWI